jgi:hypothetical protein
MAAIKLLSKNSSAWVPVTHSMAALLTVFICLCVVILAGGLDRLTFYLATRNRLKCTLKRPRPSYPLPSRLVNSLRWLHNHDAVKDASFLFGILTPLVLMLSFSYEMGSERAWNRFPSIGLGLLVSAAVFGVHHSPAILLLSRARLMRYHGFMAHLGILLVSAHGALHFISWVQAVFVKEQLERLSNAAGLAAWSVLMLLLISASVPWIRRKAYSLFSGLHHLLLFLFIPVLAIHNSETVSYGIGILAVFLLNKFAIGLQLARPAKITVEEVPNGSPSRLTLESSTTDGSIPLVSMSHGAEENKTVGKSKYLRLRLHQTRKAHPPLPNRIVYLGRKPASTFHPFTARSEWYTPIASQESPMESSGSDLLIDVYQQQGFTRSLVSANRLHVFIPWVAYVPPALRFTHITFVAGGSGITTVLAWLEYLAYERQYKATTLARPMQNPNDPQSSTHLMANEDDYSDHDIEGMLNRSNVQYWNRSPCIFPQVIQVLWIARNPAQCSAVNWTQWAERLPELTYRVVNTAIEGRPDLDAAIPSSPSQEFRELGLGTNSTFLKSISFVLLRSCV